MASASTKPQEPQPWLQALMFPALEGNGSNYLEWTIDAKTHLTTKELDGAIKVLDQGTHLAVEDLPASVHSKALQALCSHLGYSLRKECIQIEDPAELWQQLLM